ncbi:resolvase, N-terminal domain protein [Bacteriovorax sp. BAL6_X]|uniref:recombinase family protein n=1 Tax=Bacteriovorax sp. BAL6_X TaxID=1201290 RepID=UPI0003866962|nr:recombinase family protein [Bacteriovorax sp. BAL6_X]EPZ51933.1 resolvase, N-terminal domain protein [Bacteriovorax sp. BAL6_X]
MKESKYLALYVRTSTAHQKKGSISQQMYLERYCKQNNIENYKVYIDENFSGRLGVNRRPSLEKLITDVEEEKVYKVITVSLSRVSRSLKDLLNIVEKFQQCGCEFESLTESFNINNMHGRLVMSILGAVATLESEIAGERTRIGLQACKEKGIKLGRKKLISDEKIIETAKMTDLSVRSIAKLHGCSPSSVSRILKKHRTQKPCEV